MTATHAVDAPVFILPFEGKFSDIVTTARRSNAMKKSGDNGKWISYALRQDETGTTVAEAIRRVGTSEQTGYRS